MRRNLRGPTRRPTRAPQNPPNHTMTRLTGFPSLATSHRGRVVEMLRPIGRLRRIRPHRVVFTARLPCCSHGSCGSQITKLGTRAGERSLQSAYEPFEELSGRVVVEWCTPSDVSKAEHRPRHIPEHGLGGRVVAGRRRTSRRPRSGAAPPRRSLTSGRRRAGRTARRPDRRSVHRSGRRRRHVR